MLDKNYLTTMMNAWCNDNERYVREDGSTFSEYMIRDCEASDWRWFFDDEEYENCTEEDIQEVKDFLKSWDYLPSEEEIVG